MIDDVYNLQLAKLASARWKAIALEYKIRRAWRIPETVGPDAFAATPRLQLTALVPINSKVTRFLHCYRAVIFLLPGAGKRDKRG